MFQERRFDIKMLIWHHLDVRTTLTLDEDVAKSLKREMRRSGTSSLKAAVTTTFNPRRLASSWRRAATLALSPTAVKLKRAFDPT